jgi:hypothetical protein
MTKSIGDMVYGLIIVKIAKNLIMQKRKKWLKDFLELLFTNNSYMKQT